MILFKHPLMIILKITIFSFLSIFAMQFVGLSVLETVLITVLIVSLYVFLIAARSSNFLEIDENQIIIRNFLLPWRRYTFLFKQINSVFIGSGGYAASSYIEISSKKNVDRYYIINSKEEDEKLIEILRKKNCKISSDIFYT